ncbi:peptide MFS transporter [Porticoccaceae bacterium LTM1]|nr:peptide MFS transporter [Porticoccaceae bacterium LTM1]
MFSASNQPTLFGQPTGLYTLFFAEMWERFSYYGMRALLVYYMIKGFLSMSDGDAYKIYGAYTAMVYMTPFIGGMIADRLLGARRGVVFGGLLMASGHLLMTIEHHHTFFVALSLIILGNGFFKPNISSIVGSMYSEDSPKRDGGFTVFYMGVNLGAALAPLLCGYVGETYGWHYGFGMATIGMLTGLAVFVIPSKVAQWTILLGAIATAISMVSIQNDALLFGVNGFVALALIAAGIISFKAISKGGLSKEAGEAADPTKLKRKIWGIRADHMVYIGTLIAAPIIALMIAGNRSVKMISDEFLEGMQGSTIGDLGATLLGELSTPTGLILFLTGVVAIVYLLKESFKASKVERERLWVVMSLMFFSLLFWAFFEQAGSSISNFTDRNIDRVNEERVLTQADVGKTYTIDLTQEQLGYQNTHPEMNPLIAKAIRQVHTERGVVEEQIESLIAEVAKQGVFTLTALDALKTAKTEDGEPLNKGVNWQVSEPNIGMGIGGTVIPASTFQSANPIFILLFGLVFTALWTYMGKRGREPSTPIKFSLGLLQLGLGFLALWYGASLSNERGMVGMEWLLLGYLLHTTGELCLSPVGLSMVTKMSPKRLVSTVMGAWFLATAFSSYLAAIIATFTGVGHGSNGHNVIPAPIETVNVYGDVFGTIAIAAISSSVLLLLITPILVRWSHEEAIVHEKDETPKLVTEHT